MKKQQQIHNRLIDSLDYIKRYQKEKGESPSYREIMHGCHYSSVSAVTRDVHRMISMGWIETEHHYNGKIATPSELKKGETRNAMIVGSCPCGVPVEAIEDIEETVALPVSIFGDSDHIILHAKGSSMINRGIFDGDLMVVRVQQGAELGEVVVARVNGDEATAKVLAMDDSGKYYLRAANNSLDDNGNRIYKDIYPEGEWDILGVVDNIIHRVPYRDCNSN